jgi:predicted dehydrogenase
MDKIFILALRLPHNSFKKNLSISDEYAGFFLFLPSVSCERDLMTIRIGFIGCGYWGPNLVRNFSLWEDAEVVAVADLSPSRLLAVQRKFPGIETTSDARALIQRPDLDAIVIATPVFTHFELAKLALLSGKHVLVEKPLASSVAEAEILRDCAEKQRKILMVDHTFVYNPAVQKIAELIHQGTMGEIFYYDSVRVNLGRFQQDVNVIWDLATHDFSIIDYLFAEKPVSLLATGNSHTGSQIEDIAYVTLFFESSLIAHCHVNWLSPVKIRRTLIGGSKKMLIYDDVEPTEKVRLYDRGIDVNTEVNDHQLRVSYRSGDMWAPNIDGQEALKSVTREFLDSILSHKQPLTDAEAGLRIVSLLEAAQTSIKTRTEVRLRPLSLPVKADELTSELSSAA